MRTIKFRAWDSMGEKMLNMEDIFNITTKGKKTLFGWNLVFNSNRCMPMQYTGMKDKNGAEIYEGDIIKDDDWGIKNVPDIGIIEFISNYEKSLCGFYVNEHNFGINGNLAGWQREKIEVIGNIYENPELLGGE